VVSFSGTRLPFVSRSSSSPPGTSEVSDETIALLDLGAFMACDMDGSIRMWSAGCERLYGWAAHEVVGLVSHSLLRAVFPVSLGDLAATLERNGNWTGELRHRRRDGNELIVAVNKVLRRDSDGQPCGVVEVIVDMTAQRRAEMALLESEARFRTYFDNSTDCLFYVRPDAKGRLVFEAVNSAGLLHAGVTAEQVFGKTPEEALGPIVGGSIGAGLRKVFESGKPDHYQPTYDMGSGPVTYDRVSLPLRNKAGEIIGVLGSARDVTEHLRLEAALRQSQKMEALGQLASGVAHDFNNLLAAMLGSLELLEDHVISEEGAALMNSCVQTVTRGRALTGRLLTFSRQQPMMPQPADINGLVEETAIMLGQTLPGTVRIEKRLAPDLWPAVVDRNEIELAIINLAVNARDAMPLSGEVTLETRNETITEPQDDGPAPGQYVVIAVTDTGEGMTPEVLARAVDPFFSTKPSDKGTGLGLSMVYGLVRQLGGGLKIASKQGVGTCVTLYLPRADQVPPVAS
jgi:PAS domain S-box-containing protein